MERDKIGRHVVLGLLMGFQVDIRSVRRKLVLTLFSDGPSFFIVIGDSAMISGDGLQLDLYVSVDRFTYRMYLFGFVFIVFGTDIDPSLDVFTVLISTNPSWFSKE